MNRFQWKSHIFDFDPQQLPRDTTLTNAAYCTDGVDLGDHGDVHNKSVKWFPREKPRKNSKNRSFTKREKLDKCFSNVAHDDFKPLESKKKRFLALWGFQNSPYLASGAILANF